ncbi:MAG: hypothetical protein HYS09_07080 [Chloroflexi bacterium]|nr:hypothetical protein [Chloroflexota bacterium]
MTETEDPEATVRRLTQLAGLAVPEERLSSLAALLPLVQQGTETLARLDLGEREPAPLFRVPGQERSG